MDRQSCLSIFSFGEGQAKAGAGKGTSAPTLWESQVAGTSKSPKVSTASLAPAPVIVDLENLTPETLAAFFPSEHAAKK